MPRCVLPLALALFGGLPGFAREKPAPAVIELLLPAGATATADGQPLGDRRTHTVEDLKPDETRRVKLVVKFADGTEDERLVDVTAGQRIPMPVPQPGPEKSAIIAAHPLPPINSAAVSRDGKHIAFGLESNAVVVWDTAAGRPVRTLAGHQKPVLSVAFSPDDKHLVSGSADATAVLWDVATGRPVRTYKGHTGAVVSVAFAPDGRRLLTGSPEGLAIHWETDTGEPVHKLKWRGVLGVAYSPDGTTLGTASADFTATLWEAKSGKQAAVLRGHREDVNCVAFSPDGRRVLTGSSDDSGAVWDVGTGTRITRTRGHTVNVHSAAFTPDGRRVLTGDREELVVLCDAATGAHARTFAGHAAEIQSIVPSADGRTVLTGSRDGTARLWDLATGRELLALTTDATRKTWAVVSPDGLFDGSEAGRRALAYRFTKVAAEVDQFFAEGYRPGLLAEVWRGERPTAAKPLGRSKPPLVKVVSPKGGTATAPEATVVVDVTDQGGGATSPTVENNGIRVAVAAKSEPAPDGKATRFTLTVPLAPGANKLRVKAANRDGSWESAAGEVELTHPRVPGRKGRLYVVAVGVRDRPMKDVKALADLFKTRGDPWYDRVDVIPLLDRDATKAAVEDTVKDVAELTRPQDALVVLLCGHGVFVGERVHFGTDGGLDVGEVAAALGTAPALRRVLIADVAATGDAKGRSEFGLRGTVERWARTHGVHALAAVAPDRGLLASALLAAADAHTPEPLDVTDWFQSAVGRTNRPDVQASSQAKGFPVLRPAK